jgi:hypothetical protein
MHFKNLFVLGNGWNLKSSVIFKFLTQNYIKKSHQKRWLFSQELFNLCFYRNRLRFNLTHINNFNPLNAQLNPICHLLALLGDHHILHVSGLRVKAYWLRDAPNSLTFNNCRLCPHCIYVFCIYLRTNRDLCHLQRKLIGFYNQDEKCLQRGTDWVFK